MLQTGCTVCLRNAKLFKRRSFVKARNVSQEGGQKKGGSDIHVQILWLADILTKFRSFYFLFIVPL